MKTAYITAHRYYPPVTCFLHPEEEVVRSAIDLLPDQVSSRVESEQEGTAKSNRWEWEDA